MILNKPIFEESNHTYKNDKEGWFYTSGTTLVGKYKQPFDSDFWSLYNAGRRILNIPDEEKETYSKLLIKNGLDFGKKNIDNLKESLIRTLGVLYQDIYTVQDKERKDWKVKTDTANSRGTKLHKLKEDEILQNGSDISVHGFTVNLGPTNSKIIGNLFELEDGVYPELVVWNNEHKIAGQADKVTIETIAGVRYIDIDDHKTNKEIKTTSYQNKYTLEYVKMLSPVGHLMDCNYIHYSLQVSLYAYLLECFGYVVRNLRFTHIILNDKLVIEEEKPYFVKYLHSEVKAMIQNHSTNEGRTSTGTSKKVRFTC